MKKVLSILMAITLVLFQVSVEAADLTNTGTVTIGATVLGDKPQVNSFTPTTGTNDGATAVTQIIGRNFGTISADVLGVFLDDNLSTSLTGTVTLATNCDIDGSNCGSGSGYSKITGLSVPAGVVAGTYNILVTTGSGTNMVSDSKFTVTEVTVAGSAPTLQGLSPTVVSLMEGLNDSVNMTITVLDRDSAVVDFDVANISIGTVSASSGSPATTTNAIPIETPSIGDDGTHGESLSFTMSSTAGTSAGVGTMDLRVGDGGSSTTGNTATQTVNIFIEPGW